MPRDSLRAAVGNPNNLDALPRTPPSLCFRTQVFSRGADIRHTWDVLLRLGLYGAVPFFVWLFLADTEVDPVVTILLVFAALVGLRSASLRPYLLTFAVLTILATTCLSMRPAMERLVVAAAALTGVTAVLFRLHYAAYCGAGWSVFDTEHARGRWRYLLPAFCDAVVAWVCYNRHGAAVAGIVSTPAGSYRTRLYLSVNTVVLTGLALPLLAANTTWSAFPQVSVIPLLVPFLEPVALPSSGVDGEPDRRESLRQYIAWIASHRAP